MLNLTTGIYSKAAGTTLMTYIGSRLYKGRAPAEVAYPYVVYSLISDVPEYTFSEEYERALVQFSLYSIASGTTEIETIFTYLTAVYDESVLTITDATCLWMRRQNALFQVEEHTTVTGTAQVWVYHIDYEVLESLD
jgi:hypothetical protein